MVIRQNEKEKTVSLLKLPVIITKCLLDLPRNFPHFYELKYIRIAPHAATFSDSAFSRAVGILSR